MPHGGCETTAAHESGHVIAAGHFGLKATALALDEIGPGGLVGCCRMWGAERLEPRKRHVIALAGLAGEFLRTGEINISALSASDRRFGGPMTPGEAEIAADAALAILLAMRAAQHAPDASTDNCQSKPELLRQAIFIYHASRPALWADRTAT